MKSFIITLLQSDHSLTLSKDCINNAKINGICTEIYPAVNGMTDGAKKLSHYNISNILHKQIKKWPGALGCFLSHFELWNKCILLNEPIIILEHDGYFVRPLPEKIEDSFVDILNLDPFDQNHIEYNQNVINSLSDPVDYFYPIKNGTHEAGDYIYGAYGYCIKPEAANKLVNFAKSKGALPADVMIGRNIVDLMSTTVPIVRLHPYYTTENIRKDSSTANLEKFV